MPETNNTIAALVPKYGKLIEPTFQALKRLGGSGKNDEILNQIIIDLSLTDEIVDYPHLGNINQTELAYQLAWARTYLARYGVIMNSKRSVWAICEKWLSVDHVDENEIVNAMKRKKTDIPENDDPSDDPTEFPEEIKPWKSRLAEILQTMDPFGFERLTQRILRECGFTQVTVTQKSGDGGIDGIGKLMINGIFSFSVAFQCKRYSGSVGAPAVRDFRGSLSTDIEKGVLITTGSFSKAAIEEATKPGKKQIDLVDGEALISKIAEYGIGVREVTTYEIDESYFQNV